MKQTFLDETHIPAFQRGFSSGPSWTDGDGLQMACGASGYMTWPHWGLNNPLHIPSSPLHSASTASPGLAQITSRPTPGSGWLGSCPHKTFSVSLTIFFPHPCNVLAAAEPLFLLSFNLPCASSHRGDPKPCRTSRNAKHLQ